MLHTAFDSSEPSWVTEAANLKGEGGSPCFSFYLFIFAFQQGGEGGGNGFGVLPRATPVVSAFLGGGGVFYLFMGEIQ